MRKEIIGLILLASSLWGAQNLEVTSDNFTNLDKEHKAIFVGHAHATQGKSKIDANKFIVNFDEDGNAKVYQAIGNVRFEIFKASGSHTKGRCNHLYYWANKDTYKLIGNAKVEDLVKKRTITGQEIFLDNKRGLSTAKSNHSGPVKFTFPMNSSHKKGKK